MRPCFIISPRPFIDIGLQPIKRLIEIFAEGDVIKFLPHSSVGTLADAVGLRAGRLGLCVIYILHARIKLAGVVFDLAAICGAPVGENTKRRRFMAFKERQYRIIARIGGSSLIFLLPCSPDLNPIAQKRGHTKAIRKQLFCSIDGLFKIESFYVA